MNRQVTIIAEKATQGESPNSYKESYFLLESFVHPKLVSLNIISAILDFMTASSSLW